MSVRGALNIQKQIKKIVEQQQKVIEVVKEKIIEKIVERKKPIVQETVLHVPKYVEVEQIEKIVKVVEVPEIQEVRSYSVHIRKTTEC